MSLPSLRHWKLDGVGLLTTAEEVTVAPTFVERLTGWLTNPGGYRFPYSRPTYERLVLLMVVKLPPIRSAPSPCTPNA